MDLFPIELIENILRYCTGSQFCVSSRVSTVWLKAKQNIERTDESFWRNRCRQEIERHLIEELNPCRRQLDILDSYQCKELYIRWFRTQKISNLPKQFIKYSESFRSGFSNFEGITALTVTGTLVITGHRSGRVHLIDVFNNVKPIEISKHEGAVNDLVPINLVGEERYEMHKIHKRGYPTAHPSYSSHHHIISIEEGSRINITLIAEQNTGKPFQICPLTQRNFLKGKVSGDLFAVSTKEAVDISIFRLVLPKHGVVPINQSVKAELITTVSCRQVFNSTYHWLGLFTFNDFKLTCFCHEFNLIACSDVAFNLSLPKKENSRWKWKSINEVNYEYHTKAKDFDDELNVKMLNGFSFGDQIYFLITSNNEVVYTTDAKSFHLSELNYCIKKKDKILSLCLFGSVLACGTTDGYVYVHHCPTMNRLKYITHYKPLIAERICKEPIIKISITDSGMSPLLVASTNKNKIYLMKWSAEQKWVNTDLKSQSEVITID